MSRVQKFCSVEDMARATVISPPGDGFERFAHHCASPSPPAPTRAAYSASAPSKKPKPHANESRRKTRPEGQARSGASRLYFA
jgi:hypothetical protein